MMDVTCFESFYVFGRSGLGSKRSHMPKRARQAAPEWRPIAAKVWHDSESSDDEYDIGIGADSAFGGADFNPDGPPPGPDNIDPDDQKSEAAEEFIEHLLLLYAAGTISAKVLCIICHHASRAGIVSDVVGRYARKPGLQTGKYSQHLKKILPQTPSAPELNIIDVPVILGNRRCKKQLPVCPLHEARG